MAYSPNAIVAMPLNGHPKTTAMTHALHARLCSLRSAAAVATATHIMANELGKNAVDAIAIPVFVANITINIAPVIALLPLTASTRSASQYALAAPNAARTSANVDLPSSAPNSALPTIATG